MARTAIARGITHTRTHRQPPPFSPRTTAGGVGYATAERLCSSKVRAREEWRGRNIAEKKGSVFPVSRLRETITYTRRRVSLACCFEGWRAIFCLSSNGSTSAATVVVVVLSDSSEFDESTDAPT